MRKSAKIFRDLLDLPIAISAEKAVLLSVRISIFSKIPLASEYSL